MKLLPPLLLILCSLNLKAQKLFSTRNLVGYGLMMVSGAANGFTDAQVAYQPFKGNQWWDMYLSDNNKYKNHDIKQGPAFFGSTTIFVAGTDAFHCFGLVRDVTATAAVVISYEDFKDMKHKWKYLLLKGLISYGFNRAGHTLMYDVVLK